MVIISGVPIFRIFTVGINTINPTENHESCLHAEKHGGEAQHL